MSAPAAMPLAPAQRTLPGLLNFQADTWGSKPLLTLGGHAWTHADPARVAARRAAALQAAGIRRGDRVLLMCSNRPEFLDVFLGCGWLGAVVVPVNTAAMGPQIGYFLANSGARLLVIEAAYLDRLAEADLAATALQQVWLIGDVPAAAPADAGACCAGLPRQALPAGTDMLPPAALGPGDTLALMYTSGTTGPSKGVICPHAQYAWWGLHSAQVLGVRSDDVLCTTLPLFHINALNTFAQAALMGARVVFLPRFSASGFWAAMQQSQASVVYLLGAMVPMLLAQPPTAAERQHRVRVGLGPGVPASAADSFAERTGIALVEGYGSTETNFVIATTPDAPRRGLMGQVRPGFEARVVDDHDNEVPPGTAGELLLRADEPFAFSNGYFGMPDKTVEAWRNLWFHTGDRVLRDADGSLRFVDRLKDAIRRRGENISSWEVEQVLQAHPGVAAVAVYPVRSELAEDEVMAAVVPHDTADTAADSAADSAALVAELWAFCDSRLPYFAVPRFIELMAELPRTENGKVQKFRLRERGVGAGALDRGPQRRAKAG